MHEKRIEIRWRDLDAYGHVNNAVYPTYLEECRDEWLERRCSATARTRRCGTSCSRASRSTFAASFVTKTTPSSCAARSTRIGTLERDARARRSARWATSSRPRPRRCSSPATPRRTVAAAAEAERSASKLEPVAAVNRFATRTRSARGVGGLVPALEHLFSPLALGPVELQNRIVSTAHQTSLVHDHLPTDDFVAYHEARARGGAGLIVIEATAVTRRDCSRRTRSAAFCPRSSRATGASPRPSTRTGRGCSSSSCTAAASRWAPLLARRPSPRPPSRARASVSSRARCTSRDRRDRCRARARGRAGSGGRPRRGRDLRGAPLSDRAVPRPGANRRDDAVARRHALPARRAPGGAAGSARALRRRPPVGRLAAHGGDRDLLAGEGVDYVSLAIGDSSTYLGSVGIVPPPPVAENVIAEHRRPFRRRASPHHHLAHRRPGRCGPPARRRARRSRGHDPRADHRSRLPAKARSGRLDELVRCVGCNACIAHYHGDTAIRCAVNPAPVASCTSRARQPRRPRGGSWWSAPARPGSPRPSTPATLGPRGRAARALRAGSAARSRWRAQHPAGANLATTFLDNAARQLSAAGVELALGADADGGLRPRARPGRGRRRDRARGRIWTPRSPSAASSRRSSWDVLDGRLPRGDSVLVADWGGDPSGLDAAEVLAAAGKRRHPRRRARSRRASSCTSTGATSTCSGSTAPASRSSTTSSCESIDRRCGPAAKRVRTRADPRGAAPTRVVLALGRRARGVDWRPSSRELGLTVARGRRLPLAALARGSGARGHARSPRGLRVGSARP